VAEVGEISRSPLQAGLAGFGGSGKRKQVLRQ